MVTLSNTQFILYSKLKNVNLSERMSDSFGFTINQDISYELEKRCLKSVAVTIHIKLNVKK